MGECIYKSGLFWDGFISKVTCNAGELGVSACDVGGLMVFLDRQTDNTVKTHRCKLGSFSLRPVLPVIDECL